MDDAVQRARSRPGSPPRCAEIADLIARGTFVRNVPFVNEDAGPLDVPRGQGLDGRLYTDLSTLDEDSLITPAERFYVRTRYPDLLVAPDPWIVRSTRLGGPEEDVALPDLLDLEEPQGVHLLECSGNARGAAFGLLSSCDFDGIPLAALFDRLGMSESSRVLFAGFDDYSMPSAGGRSTPGASWIFSVSDLLEQGAFLATRMDGSPLLPDHGAPVRLFVPGYYGCTCIKWLDSIEEVSDDAPATSQMIEFASRTMQNGTPELARDYLPATIDLAAMPVRVEEWLLDGEPIYRVVGIAWGGTTTDTPLLVALGDAPFELIACLPQREASTWGLWEHSFRVSSSGVFAIRCRSDDRRVPTRRLDSGYYTREIEIV
jgi:DMSO/TMAO reductase YedYZ molybdopterin-dependent catalytic subunit